MENNKDTNTLLREIVDIQKVLIAEQNHRMCGYLSVIDYISTLARSKDIVIPLDKVTALIDCNTTQERNHLLIQYKTEIIHDVLDSFEETADAYAKWEDKNTTIFANTDSWSSPEWDDGVYAPPTDEVNSDITHWKVFDRKWRMFGNG
jgi:hypothetical protein